MSSTGLGFLVRSFSTSSSKCQMVKPKIQLFGTEGKYAMALYSAASKKNSLKDVEADLNKLSGLMKTDKVFREFLLDPLQSKDLKKDGINSVVKKTKANVLTANLLVLMIENGRIKNIQGVSSAFAALMAAERGEVVCEVTTAKEMDAAMTKQVEGVLKSFVKKGEKILLRVKVDPSIIGGMLVSVGDRYVDMSLSSKFNKYSGVIQAPV